MSANTQLWVVGSIGIDEIATRQESRRELLGGSASYACVAASFFAQVGMVGVVGDDFPARFMERYRRFGIDLTGLQTTPGTTFRWSGAYEDNMIDRRTLKTDLGVFADFQPCLPDSYRATPYVLLGNIDPELQLHLLDQARDAEFVATDTMDLWIRTAMDPLKRVISRSHLLTLNDGEARLLTGQHNIRECAATLLQMGPRYVVVKKGEHGAICFSRDSTAIVPAYPVMHVADPTGAGDMFAGALMGCLAAMGRSQPDDTLMRRALGHGSVVASFGVEAFSFERLERLTRPEIDGRVNELRCMAAI